MSKRMSKFLVYWTILVMVQIYLYALYQYHQTYGFDETINPATIIAYTLVLIGCFGLIGRYLEYKDIQRGYCDSGITQERIDGCKNKKNVGHIMEDSSNIKEIKDREIRERTDEDDNDSQR